MTHVGRLSLDSTTNTNPRTVNTLPATSLVMRYAQGMHYDGAKDTDCIIALRAVVPVNTIGAEVRSNPSTHSGQQLNLKTIPTI